MTQKVFKTLYYLYIYMYKCLSIQTQDYTHFKHFPRI